MASPYVAWEFMKKLSNSPWAPVIRLIEDPDVLGSEPNLNLKEDLEDCAVVLEDTDSPVQKSSYAQDEEEEDSDSVPRYCPSPPDSDESVAVCKDIERSEISNQKPPASERLPPQSSVTSSAAFARQGTSSKPCPKSKKPVPKSKSRRKVKQRVKVDQVIEYNVQPPKLKSLKVLLDDVFRVHGNRELGYPQKPLESSRDALDGPSDCVQSKSPITSLDDDSNESSIIDVVGIDESSPHDLKRSVSPSVDNLKRQCSVDNLKKPCSVDNLKRQCSVDNLKKPCSVDNLKKPCSIDNVKRPYNLSWGLDSIQELQKRRKLGKTGKKGDDQEIEMVTPCSSEDPRPGPAKPPTSKSKSKSTPSDSLPNNTFGLNPWRLGLVMEELKRLQELAEKLKKTHLKLDLQKQVAYKFKYGLNEVARLVTKKSLNSIVAEHTKLELEEFREKVCCVSNEENIPHRALPEQGQLPMEPYHPEKPKQVCQLDDGINIPTSTSKVLKPTVSDRPVDVYMPRLVQGVAAGFLGIFDRLERLESQCDQIEKAVSKSKRTIDIREVD